MSRLPSIDDYWNSYESRKPSISAYRGMAAEGSATNDMGFWGYAGDVAQAVPRGIWGAADSISEMIYYGTGGFLGNTEREAPFGIEALRGPSQTTAGGLVEGISQIAVPYGAGLKVTRAATGLLGLRGAGTAATAALGEEAVIAAAAGQRGRAALLAATSRGIEVGKMAAEGTVAGAIGDFIGFSSWAPRLSDLAVQSDNPLFNNALTQYLASDEDDSFLEGRLKNTIEGVFASGAIESVLGAARVVRAGQRAARIGTDANAAMFAEHMKIRRGHREQIMGATGATADEAELINMVVDATGMSRDRLSFAREAIQEFDEAGKPRRAAVDFYEDGKTVIRFFETADRTSPVHELSHVIRRRVLDRRIDPAFRMGMTDSDIKVIEDYVGAKNGEFDVAAEENWAQLFERFMWDGIAPNRSVAAVMERSAEFMRSVYSRVQADELLRSINPEEWAANGGTTGLKINDDVRRVMNKLMSRAPVTTTEAIRTFGKAQKRLAIMGNGRMYRTVLSAADNSLNPNEAVEAFDSVYREETLYQSSKKAAAPQGPVSAAKRRGATVTDANYPVQRGSRAIIDRLRREVSQGELKAEDADRMQQLIEKIPSELLDVMGVRFRLSKSLGQGKLGAVAGNFDYGRSIVSIASDLVRGGQVRDTWSHEWGHAMSSFLDETMVMQLRADYTRAYQKFIRLEGIDPRAKPNTPEFAELKKWSAANPARWAEVYGLTNLDEYLAVGFQSRAWKQLDIQEGTRSFIGFSRYMFHNLMLNIKSLWGGALHDRIARDLLDADFRQAKRNRMEFLKRFGFDKYKPNAKRPGMIADESRPFGDWEYRLDQQIKNQSKFWFRDFDIAENARTVGEKKSESIEYRNYNKLDENLEMRSGLMETTVPKQPTKTVTLFQSAQPPEGKQVATRFTVNGKGLLNNQVLDYAKLTDAEEARVIELMNYGLEQPREVGNDGVFYFTEEGLTKNAELIGLLKKAAKGRVKEETVFAPKETMWSSRDGQIAVRSSDVEAIPARQTLYQSAAGGQPNLPLPQPPQLSPQGGKPPQRPFNIENMSTADDVRSYHDIRIQELEADGRVQYNSMDRAEQVAAAEREMMQVADFTGYRTMPELTQALKADEDALQGFMAKHLATRMILSEAAGQLIQAREAALISGSKQDMARFVAMQQRVDVLLEHTRRNQAAVARGLGSQNIVPGPGIGVVRLVDDTMLNDPKMVDDIIDAAGGDGAVKEAMERSRLAETRGGQSGAVRATQGGRHGIVPVLTEYWMNSILSGPITFAVNATSNTAAMLYAPLEQALGASLDKNFPLMRESMMRYGAMVSEVKDAMYYAGAVLKTGDNILDKVAPSGLSGNVSARDRAISAAGFGFADNSKIGAFANFLGTVVNAPGTALSATDEFFKQLNYRSTVKAGLLTDAMQEVAAGRLAKDQMGQFVETRFQRMVEDGQFYAEKKIRADANNAAAAEIKAGTFSQGSADHLNFIKKYMKDNWNAADGELAKRARETAREATFTTALRSDRAGLEGISAKVQTLVGQHPSLRILIPFVRTPTNLALYFGQRLPISGVMYNIPHLNEVGTRFQRDITSGDPVRRAQALGRMSGGTLITMSALIAAGTGIITGSGPKDPEERAYLMKSGWQPYSFKVGNTYISYRKMDPFATFFGVAADLHEAYANSDDENKGVIETTLKGLVAAVANNIANKTYLTGLVRASNAISDAERYGADWLEQTVASFVPSLLSQSKDIFGMDPVMRDVQTISEAIRNRIPGLSEGVAPRRDVLGEPMRRAEIMGAVPMAWPFAYSKVSNDIIAQELAQLGAGFTPPRAMRNDVDLRAYVNRNGQNSYDRWQELTGQVRLGGKTLREAMEQLIRTPSYQKIDPTSVEGYESPRVGMIRKLISRYRDAAFRTTLKEFPDLMEAERHRRATVIGASSGKPFAQLLQYSRGR